VVPEERVDRRLEVRRSGEIWSLLEYAREVGDVDLPAGDPRERRGVGLQSLLVSLPQRGPRHAVERDVKDVGRVPHRVRPERIVDHRRAEHDLFVERVGRQDEVRALLLGLHRLEGSVAARFTCKWWSAITKSQNAHVPTLPARRFMARMRSSALSSFILSSLRTTKRRVEASSVSRRRSPGAPCARASSRTSVNKLAHRPPGAGPPLSTSRRSRPSVSRNRSRTSNSSFFSVHPVLGYQDR